MKTGLKPLLMPLPLFQSQRLSPSCSVLRQGLIGQAFQQILRFGMGKQFRPFPLRFQLGRQEAGESVLFRLRELGSSLEGLLKKLVPSAFLRR